MSVRVLRERAPKPAAAKAKPAKRAKARNDDVLQALRERISQHQILPGTRLNEQELASEFGVSRAVIRDVFAKLEQRGLIVRSPNRSAMVARLDLAQVMHIFQVREVLEGLCAKLAAQNVPPESWQDLVDLFGEPMEEHVRKSEFEEVLANLQLLRPRLIDAAGNPLLKEMLDNVNDRVQGTARRIIVLPGRAEHALGQHRAVLAALRRGDADESERLRRENIRSGPEYLKRYQRFVL